jgi:hypothetical protein
VARRRADQPPLRFRGPPAGLQAFAALAPETVAAPEARVTVDLGKARSIEPLPIDAAAVADGASHVRLSLPPTTPPGTYEGSLRAGKVQLPLSVEVEPYPSLRLAPAQLLLEAEPKASVDVHVTALNDGNVPLEIPRASAFGLFEVDGAERSVRAAFTTTPARGRTRLDHLVEELADSHGGLVRVQIAEGSGTLDPGEVRALLIRLRFSDTLERDQTYSGTWSLHTLRYYVRVTVPPARAQATRRRRAG